MELLSLYQRLKKLLSNTGKRPRHSLELPQISHPEYKPNPVAIGESMNELSSFEFHTCGIADF